MVLHVSQLTIYPIKSLSGIQLDEVFVEKKGFQHDRRWMLVNEQGQHITQRKFGLMALLQPKIEGNMMHITHKQDASLRFSFDMSWHLPERLKVTVWGDECEVHEVSKEASAWFSRVMGTPCQLVYMPEDFVRLADPKFSASPEDQVSFADGYPILLFDEASVALISEKSGQEIPVNRFRPNIVTRGGHAHVEDELKRFSIGGLDFYGAKPCSRCVMTTIDQETAEKGKEPLKTLSTYRMAGRGIKFGMNVIPLSRGIIRVGDAITVKETVEPLAF